MLAWYWSPVSCVKEIFKFLRQQIVFQRNPTIAWRTGIPNGTEIPGLFDGQKIMVRTHLNMLKLIGPIKYPSM